MEHVLFSFFDKNLEKPVFRDFEKKLKVGDVFMINDVNYEVYEDLGLGEQAKPCFRVKIISYKIKSTTTTIVHKCEAIKNKIKKLDSDNFKKCKKKLKDSDLKYFIKQGRLKIRTNDIKNYCPTCGVIFYKDERKLPDPIEVISLKNKVKLKKRL